MFTEWNKTHNPKHLDMAGKAWHGEAGYGPARQGRRGEARLGKARYGKARRVMARQPGRAGGCVLWDWSSAILRHFFAIIVPIVQAGASLVRTVTQARNAGEDADRTSAPTDGEDDE